MYLELFQYSLQRGRQLVGLAFVADEEVVLYGGMKDFTTSRSLGQAARRASLISQTARTG